MHISGAELSSVILGQTMQFKTLKNDAQKVLNILNLTRAQRGYDSSPEYNEHFCYKLDSRVQNLTTEWNEKQQHFMLLDHCYEFNLLL